MKSIFTTLALLILTSFAQADENPDRQKFKIDGCTAFVILPEKTDPTKPTPWVLDTPTFEISLPSSKDEGWMMKRFLDKGIAVAGVDVGESYGSPGGQKIYTKLHAHHVEKCNFDKKAKATTCGVDFSSARSW